MRRRETTLEEDQFLFEKTSLDVTAVIDNFKKEFSPKIMIDIEPLLNAILTNPNIRSNDQETLITSIHDQINLYYYMNTEILIKIIDYGGKDMKKKLKKVKGNPIDILDINQEEYNSLKKNQKEIYQLKFDNLVDRYITFLINVL